MTGAAFLAAMLLAAAPAAAGPEPGAVPAVALAPAVARPGDAVLVRVRAPPAAPLPAGTLAGRPLQFFRHGDEAWALAALPLETPPGLAPVELGAEPGGARAAATLEVVEPGFASRALRLPPRFVEPPRKVRRRMQEDRRAFAAAYDRPFEPPLFRGRFGWPRDEPVTGRYGDQRVLNGKKQSVHYGLDLDAPRGAPVLASNDGVVVLARDAYLSGNSVVLAHGADVFTLYFHMARIDVRAGQRVAKGERLGVVGSTGRSTGPHLHWSARVAGLLVDPESLVGIDLAAGTAPPRRAGPPPAAGPPADAPAEEVPHPSAARAVPGAAATPAVTEPAPPR